MHVLPHHNLRNIALSTGLSSLLVLMLFCWQGATGFSLWDEGFLWYGAQRVMLGEVPIRDFMAYDPGRYYWSAALMNLLHNNGIMSLRASVALFEVVGLAAGIFIIARTSEKPDYRFLLLSCLILATWMFPRHKLFDTSLSIFTLCVLTFLIEHPTSRQFFITGIGVGVIAIFGRNHGIYAVFASAGAMLWLQIKKEPGIQFVRNFLCWASGIVVGFAPLIGMALFIPGFALAFWESVKFIFEMKATNLPLPIPWPWLTQFELRNLADSIRAWCIGLFFIGVLVFGILSLILICIGKYRGTRHHPTLVAASLLALPYAQFAFSRADVGHLAQGIFPFLVGSLVCLSSQSAKIKWTATTLLALAGFLVLLPLQPGWQCYAGQSCVEVEISGSHLSVDDATRQDIERLRLLAAKYAPGSQSFIATPVWPGAYALLERKAPMWEIYALHPHSARFQQAEIERIRAADPQFAIILDIPIDGRDDLRFKNSHPLINAFIREHFTLLNDVSTTDYLVYKKSTQSTDKLPLKDNHP